jgi:hypothetical protein
MKPCAAVNEYDGCAIHEHVTDEIRGLDFALSQRHRAALYAGDPQWTEIGVKPGYNPTSSGRRAEMPASLSGRPGEAATGEYFAEAPSGGSKARRKSPGIVWQYEGKGPETQVKLHTLPGDALQALDNHAKDLRSKLSEALGVVFMDPESLPNESRLSGKALESFKGRQLDRVNYYRADFGDKFMLPALGMLIRIAIEKKLPIKKIDVLKTAIAKYEMWSWHSPAFELEWGNYFDPTGEDEFQMMQATALGVTTGFITKKQAVRKRKDIIGVRDVEGYMTELEAEAEENQQREIEMAKATKPAPTAGQK